MAPVLVVPAVPTMATGTRPAALSSAMAARTASTSIRCWSSTGTGTTPLRPSPSTAADRWIVWCASTEA